MLGAARNAKGRHDGFFGPPFGLATPAPNRLPTARIASKPEGGPLSQIIYKGFPAQDASGELVVIERDGDIVGPLTHRAKHSPSGMNWGYAGSGPADLARSILIHALQSPQCHRCDDGCPYCDKGFVIQPELCQNFKFEVIAKLPHNEKWDLPQAEVLEWVGEWRAKHGGLI